MTSAVPIARFAGSEIKVHLSWVIVLALVTGGLGADLTQPGWFPAWSPVLVWLTAGLTALAIFVSVTLHELSHLAVGRSRGLPAEAVTIHLLGGTYLLEVQPLRARDELLVAAAGPLASLVLALGTGLFAFLLPSGADWLDAASFVLSAALLFNVFLAVVNLIPGYPLDGARLVHGGAWAITADERRATMIASRLGRWMGLAMMVAGIVLALRDTLPGLILFVAGWMMGIGARSGERRLVLDELMTGLSVSDALEAEPPRVPPQLTLDTFAEEYLANRPGQAVLVERDGEIIGLLGFNQLRKAAKRNWGKLRAEQVMVVAARVPRLAADVPLASALELLQRTGLDGLLVAATDTIGLLTRRSATAAVQARVREAAVVGPRSR